MIQLIAWLHAFTEWIQQLAYLQRLQIALIAAVLCGLYLHFIIRRLSPSVAAIAATAPVVIINSIVPLIFDYHEAELLSRGIAYMLLIINGNLKAISLAYNRGALSGNWSAAETVILFMLPIYPSFTESSGGNSRGRLSDKAGSSHKVAMSFACNTTLLCVVAYMLANLQLPLLLKYYVYAFGLYGFVTMIMEGTAAVLIALLDLHIVPPFDKPWLAVSLQDFWGRRWNNTISHTLRAAVYDPIMEGHLFNTSSSSSSTITTSSSNNGAAKNSKNSNDSTRHKKAQHDDYDSDARHNNTLPAQNGGTVTSSSIQQQQQHNNKTSLLSKALATTAIFAVSGLFHEWGLYLMSMPGEYHAGYWFMFFQIQAPLMVCEGLLLYKLKAAGVTVPRIVRIVATTCCTLLTAHWFWYKPVLELSGLADRVVGCVNRNVAVSLQAVGFPIELSG